MQTGVDLLGSPQIPTDWRPGKKPRLKIRKLQHKASGGGGHKGSVGVPVATPTCVHWFGVSGGICPALFDHSRWGNVLLVHESGAVVPRLTNPVYPHICERTE